MLTLTNYKCCSLYKAIHEKMEGSFFKSNADKFKTKSMVMTTMSFPIFIQLPAELRRNFLRKHLLFSMIAKPDKVT